jgi:hypothetical protein
MLENDEFSFRKLLTSARSASMFDKNRKGRKKLSSIKQKTSEG